MTYENVDGFVCDMQDGACVAKYDFGDADFKVDFFGFLDSVEKFTESVDERAKALEVDGQPIGFYERAKIERDISNEIFVKTDALLGDGWRDRHVETKSVFRLARAIGELANFGVEAVGKLVDETETMVNSYVNRAQRRAAQRAGKA